MSRWFLFRCPWCGCIQRTGIVHSKHSTTVRVCTDCGKKYIEKLSVKYFDLWWEIEQSVEDFSTEALENKNYSAAKNHLRFGEWACKNLIEIVRQLEAL